MVITQEDAVGALRDVERTQARAQEANAYRLASPHLILWGLIWMVGYTANGLTPVEQWGWPWAPLILVGTIGSVWLGTRHKRAFRGQGARPAGVAIAAYVAAWLLITLFFVASYALFAPRTPQPYLVFPALVTGLIYVLLGVTRMLRLVWIGGAIIVLAIVGFVWFEPVLPFWIAAVGGGGLILGGLWLRKV